MTDPSAGATAIGALRSYYDWKARAVGGAGQLIVSFPGLPKSLNHQYVRRGKGRSYDLDPDTKLFRDVVAVKLSGVARTYRPQGLLAAIIVFRSSCWVTKESTCRDIDIDNKVKPLMDAFELATGIRDSRFWALHAFKEMGATEATVLSVYDLGDIVER